VELRSLGGKAMMTKTEFYKEFKVLVEFYGPRIAKMTDTKADYYFVAFESWRLEVFKTACKLWKNSKPDKFPSLDELRSFKVEAERINPENFDHHNTRPKCELCDGTEWVWFGSDIKSEKHPSGYATRCECAGGNLTHEERKYIDFRKTEFEFTDFVTTIREAIKNASSTISQSLLEKILKLYLDSGNSPNIQTHTEVPY
jgi:hypothetical protein